MKKILAILLALILLAVPMTALAYSTNANAGTVPKVAPESVPAIDGVKDAIYDKGLFIPVRNDHSATPAGGLGGGADAWMLWDDSYVYIFMKVDLAGSTLYPDNYDEVKMGNQWMLTTTEILIDFSNEAIAGSDVFQVRLDDRGYPNVTIGAGNGEIYGNDCLPYVETGYTRNGDSSYTIECKIKYNEVKKAGEINGMNLGSALGANKQIGLYIFSQECAADGAQALFVSVPTDQSGNWNPDLYDYVVLGASVVGTPEPPAETEPPTEAETQASTQSKDAPKTGDTVLPIFILAAVLSLAPVVIFKAKRAKR